MYLLLLYTQYQATTFANCSKSGIRTWLEQLINHLNLFLIGIGILFRFQVRCLYPKTAIFAHCCTPNIRHSIFPNLNLPGNAYRVYVRAAIKIEKGQEILISYTHTLAPTLFRRMHLRESKYFDCTCARCSDPSELGTHLSTLKCHKCDNGVVMSTNSLGKSR